MTAEQNIYTGKKVLVIEDERNIADTLTGQLNDDGFKACCAYDGRTGFEMIKSEKPDIVTLDIRMPELDGITICRRIRANNDPKISQAGIVIVTASDSIDYKIVAFKNGANDYIIKPFSYDELELRIRAILSRTPNMLVQTNPVERKKLVSKNLSVDLDGYSVSLDNKLIDFSKMEFQLLVALMENKGAILTIDSLINMVWGDKFLGDRGTVNVHIRKVREKIEKDPGDPRRIRTFRGIGYRFEG